MTLQQISEDEHLHIGHQEVVFCLENKNKMCSFQRVARVPKKPDRRYSFFVILSGKKMGSSRSNNEPVSDPSGVRV